MRQALGLARRGLGEVWPNPAVGCVILRDGAVVGRGWTQPGGRPHAEAEALARAGKLASGATAYVTLEPCSHHGQTPPCADALAAAGIRRVVCAIQDPDPRVSGTGFSRMRDAGLRVDEGLLADHASALIAGFLIRAGSGRPLVTAKLATTLDGRIATHGGESRWITGDDARQTFHLLRAEHDAVMVGSTTAMVDDPDLTCRLPGFTGRPRIRVVIDGRLRLPLTARLVRTAREVPTWLMTRANADKLRREAYMDAGIEVISVSAGPDGAIDPADAAHQLGARGLTSILLEGGGKLVGAFLRAGLVDRVAWFRAPRIIGGDGIAAIAPFGIDKLADARSWRRLAAYPVGDDVLELLSRPF
jgi:diaminohydroxyphosphoribosylaminopyrimidine deaminase/5-amino-6-(5-phosphoribosylamino)uracil reductase